jgi:hypothetical protein
MTNKPLTPKNYLASNVLEKFEDLVTP